MALTIVWNGHRLELMPVWSGGRLELMPVWSGGRLELMPVWSGRETRVNACMSIVTSSELQRHYKRNVKV